MNYSEEVIDIVQKSNGVVTPKNYFVQVHNSFIRNSNLNSKVRYMYVYLLGFGGESKCMYPGMERMEEDLGWSRRTIIRVLKELEECGGLYIINRKYKKSQKKATNLYYLSEIDINTGNFDTNSLNIVREIYPEKFTYIN